MRDDPDVGKFRIGRRDGLVVVVGSGSDGDGHLGPMTRNGRPMIREKAIPTCRVKTKTQTQQTQTRSRECEGVTCTCFVGN